MSSAVSQLPRREPAAPSGVRGARTRPPRDALSRQSLDATDKTAERTKPARARCHVAVRTVIIQKTLGDS